MNDRIVIESGAGASVKHILMGFILCLVSAGVFLTETSTAAKAAAGIGALLFGGRALFLIKKATQRKTLLVIDENGIMDDSNAIALGFIPWTDVQDVSLHDSVIGVELTDTEKYLKDISPIKRKAIQANLALGLPAVCISLVMSSQKPEDVFLQMMGTFHRVKEKKQ